MKNRKFKIVLAAAVLCLGVVGAAGTAIDNLSAEAVEIPEHDGDILVDSLNVQTEDSGETEETDESEKETELVTSDDISDLEQGDTYFQEMRATINLDRNEMIAMYTDAEATAATDSEKKNATEKKNQLLDNMQKEKDVESAIKAKGLPECFVLITESGANITVNKQELNSTDVAKICDIVMRETGLAASEIIIQSKF
ncbi:MAG: SpoIIIAH-like family protein [Firmicutes bacterium]|nr:SpoIIIAH-like family protein [Bacillota bacterium]